jgi:hypothetical protein
MPSRAPKSHATPVPRSSRFLKTMSVNVPESVVIDTTDSSLSSESDTEGYDTVDQETNDGKSSGEQSMTDQLIDDYLRP